MLSGHSVTGDDTGCTWAQPRFRPRSLCLRPANADPRATSLAQLFLAEPVVAVYGQPFVLREESPPATLGGGRVLQPLARCIRRRDGASIDRLARLADPDPMIRLSAALAAYGSEALD